MTNEITTPEMRILIATDGSQHSDAVIEMCCRKIINEKTANVLVVSVYEPPLMAAAAAPYAFPVQYSVKIDEELRAQAADFAERAERRLCECLPGLAGKVATRVVRGAPAPSIVLEAEEWKADLIIVGSHGYGFWERMLLGSVSNAVVHHAPCSVLVVRKP